ncbi:MAG: error-prone DNA polymerase [Planctomycetes bacterium]|nr:error-prone DNA polymerase [Planctomycetota bacterium]
MPHFVDPHGPREVRKPALERDAKLAEPPHRAGPAAPYAELVCCTNFSFLRGASHAHELVQRAADLGLTALAITDWHSLAGIVRAHEAAKECGLKLLVGARVQLREGIELCLYAMSRKGYGNLCRLLTTGKRRADKGQCNLELADLQRCSGDLQAILNPGIDTRAAAISPLRSLFEGRLSVAIMRHLEPGQERRVTAGITLARQAGLPVVAVNDVHFHDAGCKPLQDVLACVREGVRIDEAAHLLFPNAERRLKSGDEMAMLFADMPQAIRRGVEIAETCQFSLDELRYEYPHELTEDDLSQSEYLRRETMRGARTRYPAGIPAKVTTAIEHELAIIAELQYEPYFLTVYDIVRFARSREILCQGRGSAANSAVCFCLGITSVDPAHNELLFERFMSRERAEPPDIDIDFEHERREEVIQYVYNKYGRERAGMCATVIHYRTRSALREVGRVLGLTVDQVDRLSKSHHWFDDIDSTDKRLVEVGLDPASKEVRTAIAFARRIRGFPRHLSQHVGGMVMTRGRLDELVPIENARMPDRSVIEWDKDDIDTLGILKVDILSLGMLTAIRKCFAMVESHGGRSFNLATCLATDPNGLGETAEAKSLYEMLCHADSVGTFQVESRAQMSMLPRLKPNRFYDLVVEVAIVRPGPIQGGMVHPYLRRRNGEEPVDYPHPDAIPALQRTLGVPLFQEQAMRLAVDVAGFSPGEADRLRKAMGGWRRPGVIEQYQKKLIDGMQARGITAEYAERVYNQIKGFGEYGFPESHSVSFALLSYVSCYLKRFYPAAFTASVLNSQPMGFYSASALVRDARDHGVEVRPVDINASHWDCTLEAQGVYAAAGLDAPPGEWGKAGPALRLGLRQLRGFSEAAAIAIATERESGVFESPVAFARRMHAGQRPVGWREFSILAQAGAFDATGVSRREALWQLLGRRADPGDLLAHAEDREKLPLLAGLTDVETMNLDYRATSLSLNHHPLEFHRAALEQEGVLTARQLQQVAHKATASVAGRTVVRQRPGEGKMLFFTLEDETGTANLMLTPKTFEANREAALSPQPIVAEGTVERSGEVVHLRVKRMYVAPATEGQPAPETVSRDFH